MCPGQTRPSLGREGGTVPPDTTLWFPRSLSVSTKDDACLEEEAVNSWETHLDPIRGCGEWPSPGGDPAACGVILGALRTSHRLSSETLGNGGAENPHFVGWRESQRLLSCTDTENEKQWNKHMFIADGGKEGGAVAGRCANLLPWRGLLRPAEVGQRRSWCGPSSHFTCSSTHLALPFKPVLLAA